jgi:SAM-dependent methyltransferase
VADPANQSLPEFDGFAEDYDAALARGLVLSGEDKGFFARGRVAWMGGCLERQSARPKSILDFGCGTGTASALLLQLKGAESVLGVDISARSIGVAQQSCRSQQVSFRTLADFVPEANIDLAFCNGVFHHIPVMERRGVISVIHRALRSGGLFAFWENNPWNPGTRWVMHRIPFDRNAILLWPSEARKLLRQGGFEVLHTDFQFVFPRSLAWLRRLEPFLAQWPLGGQYLVLCRKP